MALSELLNIAKYSSGYHGDGPAAATPDLGFLNPNNGFNKKEAIALKLLQLKSQIENQQAQVALRKKQLDVWSSVGTPSLSDKSTTGDVSKIVDTEEVGGRDANVVNDGSPTMPSLAIPADTRSNSSLVNMVKGYQPTISTAGNMILTKKKPNYSGVAKHYDEARTFSYAKRLADQAIIQSGKTKKDVSEEDYNTLINDQMPKAETYLYGKPLSQPKPKEVDESASDPIGVKKMVDNAIANGRGEAPAPGSTGNAPQVGNYTEGQTAINPKTGKRLQFKGGKWQAMN